MFIHVSAFPKLEKNILFVLKLYDGPVNNAVMLRQSLPIAWQFTST